MLRADQHETRIIFQIFYFPYSRISNKTTTTKSVVDLFAYENAIIMLEYYVRKMQNEQ